MRRRGFSLFELLIVIGVTIVIGTIGTLLIGSRQATTDLDSTASQIVSALRTAQQNALASASSTSWGVHFDNTTTTSAYWSTFASSTWSVESETSRGNIPERIAYDPSALEAGDTLDVVFAQGTGRPAATSTIIVRVKNSDRAYQINVSAAGLVGSELISVEVEPEGGWPAPTVAGIAPTSGVNNSSINISGITGSGFRPGATVKITRAGQSDISGSGFSVVNGTNISAGSFSISGAQAGAWSVVVTNPNALTGTCVGCFTVENPPPAPTASDVAPSSRAQGMSNQDLTITGTGFINGASTAFSGTGITVNGTTFNSATSLTVNVSLSAGATLGARNVTVTNPDTQQGVCSSCFTVNAAPTVASTNPSTGSQGASGLSVQITGTGFASGAVASFSGAGITVNNTTYNSPTQVTASITIAGGATTGARNVTVTNTDGGAGTGNNVFTVTLPVPTATSTSPNNRGQGASNQNITINGTNFVNGAAATFSGTGITVNSTTFNSASSLTANITVAGGATTGARNVTVTNPDAQQGVCSSCFTVNAAPTVVTATPSTGNQGVTINVAITGTGFVTGASTTFSGTGITVNSTTHNSSTQVTANITIAGGATASARNITFTNADGSTGTGNSKFTVTVPPPAPTVSSPSPNSAAKGSSNINIGITGTNFVSGAAATFSGTGITVNSTTFNSATSLTANISIAGGAASGARNITVTNPDTQSGSCTSCFTVTSVQTNTGYLLGSVAVTGGTGTFTSPNFGDWFTDNAPPTRNNEVGLATFTSGQTPYVTFTGFNFGIPAGSTIDKICLQMNNVSAWFTTTGTQQWRPTLTWNGGSSFTSANTSMPDINDTTYTGFEAFYTGTTGAPDTSDPGTLCTNWGRTWSQSETSSGNFGVRITGNNDNAGSAYLRFDLVRVKIYYTP